MGMNLRLQRFCCCCSLRTGTLIIGTAGWILTFLELFCMVGPAVDKSETKSDSFSYGDDEFENRLDHLSKAIDKAEHKNFYYSLGYAIVSLIICVLLVVGVYKKDKRFVLPWLVLKCFEGVILILGTILVFILACAFVELQALFFVFTFVLIIVSVITWYTWLCVYSHYRDLGEGAPNDGSPPVYYAPTSSEAIAPPAYNFQEQEKSKFGLA